jgi:hypothetical protein
VTRLEQLIAVLVLSTFVPQQGLADVVVLRNQKQYRGTIANRDAFSKNPATLDIVSVLPSDAAGDSTDILRIAAADIEYVILEDGADKRVFDMRTLRSTPPMASETALRTSGQVLSHGTSTNANRTVGAVLGATGIIAAGIGLAFKFGGPKLTGTGSSLQLVDESYNGANYALFVCGLAMSITGVVVASIPSDGAIALNRPQTTYLGASIHF